MADPSSPATSDNGTVTVPSPIPAVQPTAFTQIPGHYLKEFGEYRTQRYVRRAFDQLERGELPGLNG